MNLDDIYLKPLCYLCDKEIEEYIEALILELQKYSKLDLSSVIINKDNRINCKGQILDCIFMTYNTKRHINLLDLIWTIAHEVGHVYHITKDARRNTEYYAEKFALEFLKKKYFEYWLMIRIMLYTEVMYGYTDNEDQIHYNAYTRIFNEFFI